MPTEKLSRILRAKSPFNADQISAMSEVDGWNWVYANAVRRKDRLIQVCFTGFSAAEKETLISLADESQLEVVTSVTKSLAFLCAGDNAGPTKLSKASSQGVTVLTREQFEHLLSTGEVAA